jgi:ribosome modulation factor
MAFTRKCRKALSASRSGKTNQKRYHACVDAGEVAYAAGDPWRCPYTDKDDVEAWTEGWYLAHEDATKAA